MIGIVVVSHSRRLAEAAVEVARQMVPAGGPEIAVAAGMDDGSLGTRPPDVQSAIEQVDSPDGVLVVLDFGSAVLSTRLAIEQLAEATRARVVVTPAPLVEGLVAALVTAASGGNAREAATAAEAGLADKTELQGDGGMAPTTHIVVSVSDDGDMDATAVITIANAHGLHVRPAARLVAEIHDFEAEVRLRDVTTGSDWVEAASLAQITALGVLPGHQVEIDAHGPGAQQAIYALVALAEAGFGEGLSAAFAADAESADPVWIGQRPRPASPGYGIGPARHLVGAHIDIPDEEPGEPEEQYQRLEDAISEVQQELAENRDRTARLAGQAEAAVFEAHRLLLRDPGIVCEVRNRIDDGQGAAAAWAATIGTVADQIAALGNDYLRARAVDVRGVGDQVLRALLGVPAAQISGPGILVLDDIDPSSAARLDASQVGGILLAAGSPTAHAAILTRAKGIPMITGAGPGLLAVAEGTPVAMDGTRGEFVINPPPDAVEAYERRAQARAAVRARAQSNTFTPARMADDGPVVAVAANVSSVDEAIAAAAAGAEGSGLVRTEFLFADRPTPPSAQEQEDIYRAIAEAFDGKRIVIRTLDAGGDKPVRFLPRPPEDNPFLGVRGMRLILEHPRILHDQLAAICAVARDHPVSVLFPMVVSLGELRQARALLARAAGLVCGRMPEGLQVGIMVEVPSVALKGGVFAPMVDFFSVGTNDLTQYALAADRLNPALAGLADGLDPGVLRLIRALCRSARGRVGVSVCGELAADPAAVPILLGLGARGLSVSPPAVAEVKEWVRCHSLHAARSLARQAMACPDAAAVRALTTTPRSD